MSVVVLVEDGDPSRQLVADNLSADGFGQRPRLRPVVVRSRDLAAALVDVNAGSDRRSPPPPSRRQQQTGVD